MSIEAVVFDIGGVVVDVDLNGYEAPACEHFLCQPEDLRSAVGAHLGALETGHTDTDTFWDNVGEWLKFNGKGQLGDPARLRTLWRKVMKQSLKVNQAMLSFCWELQRRGLCVAALSNTIADHAEHLGSIGVYMPFKPCILSCDVGLRKPNKAIYQLAAKKIGKPIQNCLLVDDLAVNVEGALAAGMQAHLFTDLENLKQALAEQKVV